MLKGGGGGSRSLKRRGEREGDWLKFGGGGGAVREETPAQKHGRIVRGGEYY